MPASWALFATRWKPISTTSWSARSRMPLTLCPDRFELEFTNLTFDFARGRRLTFRGFMDRVDVAQKPNRVRVTDYKSGKYIWQDEDEFKGGRNVQLAIYVLAAA